MCVIAAGNDRRCSASEEHSFDISTSAKLKSKKRDIKMQWKYVVLQYLVLGPGLAFRVQSLVLALALSFESLVLALALKVKSLVLALALSLKSLLTSL